MNDDEVADKLIRMLRHLCLALLEGVDAAIQIFRKIATPIWRCASKQWSERILPAIKKLGPLLIDGAVVTVSGINVALVNLYHIIRDRL